MFLTRRTHTFIKQSVLLNNSLNSILLPTNTYTLNQCNNYSTDSNSSSSGSGGETSNSGNVKRKVIRSGRGVRVVASGTATTRPKMIKKKTKSSSLPSAAELINEFESKIRQSSSIDQIKKINILSGASSKSSSTLKQRQQNEVVIGQVNNNSIEEKKSSFEIVDFDQEREEEKKIEKKEEDDRVAMRKDYIALMRNELATGEIIDLDDTSNGDINISEAEKERIEEDFKREFWASQMTMRDSLKKDGGEFLLDQTKYKDKVEGYKNLGNALMERRKRQKRREMEERQERELEMSRKDVDRTGKWSNLPLPEEYEKEYDDDVEQEGAEIGSGLLDDDGLPDMTRLAVRSNITAPQTYQEMMDEATQDLVEDAKTDDIDEWERTRRLKRIDFMAKKLALKEKQRQERFARMGVKEDDIVEIDPADFRRYQDGEITEEELEQLSRKHSLSGHVENATVVGEDGEEMEVEEDEEDDDYEFLRHWKIGSIQIPSSLKRKISQQLKGLSTAQLRIDSAELSENLRNRTRSKVVDKTTPYKVAPEEQPVINYGPGQALAYVAHRMPGVYSCTHRVFQEIATRIPNFKPKTLIDYGSGPGTVLWSAKEVWGDSLTSIRAIEPSTFMTDIAKKMLEGQTNEIKWSQFLIQPQQLTEGMQSDLVVASYVLSELPDQASREALVRDLWRNVKPSGMLVLVEPGTPIGFSLVRHMRQMLLDQPVERVTIDKTLHAQVVAPCPHSEKCPMGHNSWCHFSQRVERPIFQKLAKGPRSTVSFEDEKYSYIAISKMIHSNIPNQLEKQLSTYGPEEVNPTKPWSRINEAPFKRGGHVILDLCTPTGDLKRMTIARSHGKTLYKEARKSFWSDGIIVDPDLVHWIISRNQMPQSEIEKLENGVTEEETNKKKDKKDKLNVAFNPSKVERELRTVIDETAGRRVDKKMEEKKTQELEQKKKDDWMKELSGNDRKMLEKLVKDGKYGNQNSLFNVNKDDMHELTEKDNIDFEEDKKPKRDKKMRESARTQQELKKNLKHEIQTMELQNMQPDEREEYERHLEATRPPRPQRQVSAKKKGTMEDFLSMELDDIDLSGPSLGIKGTKDDGSQAVNKALEHQMFANRVNQRAQLQQQMFGLVDNVQGMGLNSKSNRKSQQPNPLLKSSNKSTKK